MSFCANIIELKNYADSSLRQCVMKSLKFNSTSSYGIIDSIITQMCWSLPVNFTLVPSQIVTDKARSLSLEWSP
jgi:hypothetical protein